MDELVVYHNDLNNFQIGSMTKNQANLFVVLVKELRNNDSLTLSYDRIMQELGMEKNNNHFKKLLVSTYSKFLNVQYWNVEIKENGKTSGSIRNIFEKFDWDDEKETVTIKVIEAHQYLFKELQKLFTQFSLSEFLKIKSGHSKTLYRLLKQWRTTGQTPVCDIDRFKFLFGLSKSYKLGDIDRRVLNPALKELNNGYFTNLEVHKKYAPPKGRGRRKLLGYYFTFVAEEDTEKKAPAEMTQQNIADITGWKKTGWICPKCKRPIYQTTLENENGSYMIFGHTDYKTGECDFHTADSAELLDPAKIEPDLEELTEEQKENKKKLGGLFSGLFR